MSHDMTIPLLSVSGLYYNALHNLSVADFFSSFNIDVWMLDFMYIKIL
jgi:hypothetical protein